MKGGGIGFPPAPFCLLSEIYFLELDLGVVEDLLQGVKFVGAFVVDIFDAGIDEDFDAVDAGRVGDID